MRCDRREVSNSCSHVAGLLLLIFCFSAPAWAAPQSDGAPAVAPVAGDAVAGKPIFERYCSPCHGITGGGGRGPRLDRSYLPHAPDDSELQSVISNGIPPGMPDASYLSDQ